MASGAPDWYVRTKTDIVAQTIAELVVDIASQSVGNLAVNVAAQTLSALGIDIKSASMGNLPIDIKAATLGNLAIDVKAQTIGNLGIDLKAQTLSIVTNRPVYGGANVANYSGRASPYALTTMISINGKGMTYGGYIFLYPAISHATDVPQLKIDGNTIQAMTLSNLNDFNFKTNIGPPMLLRIYDDIKYRYVIVILPGMTFDSNVSLLYYNYQGDNPTVIAQLNYATV